jgi:broad specificity phosphatase PhoE
MPRRGDGQRELAVFRHARTKKGAARDHGSHLSAEGVALARRVGADLGSFDVVYVTPAPRAMETALSMAFAVDRAIEFTCGYVPGEFEHHAQWAWEQPFARFAELVRSGGKLARAALADAKLWARTMAELPSAGRALIVMPRAGSR